MLSTAAGFRLDCFYVYIVLWTSGCKEITSEFKLITKPYTYTNYWKFGMRMENPILFSQPIIITIHIWQAILSQTLSITKLQKCQTS